MVSLTAFGPLAMMKRKFSQLREEKKQLQMKKVTIIEEEETEETEDIFKTNVPVSKKNKKPRDVNITRFLF